MKTTSRSFWKGLTALLFSAGLFLSLFGATEKYRLTWRDNPATTMVVGWVQTSGSSPKVHYDTQDHGTNTQNYSFQMSPSVSRSSKGMTHQFARLTNLQPDTAYYFVVADSNSVSQRFWFRTAPSSAEPFTMIAGGDSRNNASTRRKANRMVAKLRPLFVAFGGDMTDADSNSQWQQWLEDWQDTIASDGRMFPIVAARGNHERANSVIVNIFDVPHSQVYYALTFGGNLLRTYTLNSEDTEGGNQANWLSGDLQFNQNVTWRMAQYHKPMRPHVSSKSEGWDEYDAWADLFYQHKVQLVVECDSHCVKSSWPVRPTYGSGNDEGFVRDDENGTVYVGEGTWGAPLRSANDGKNWTRNSGSFNQFKWIHVTPQRMEVKTILYENVSQVGQVNDNDPWAEPSGLDVWNPSNGSVIVIENDQIGRPTVQITQPQDNQFFDEGQTVQINAQASMSDGTIGSVRFYANDTYLGQDTSAPYSFSWNPSANGEYRLRALATANNGETAEDTVEISVGVQTLLRTVSQGTDDAEERSSGSMYLDSSDLELVRDGTRDQIVGIRFNNLHVPPGASVSSAYIQFTVDETSTETTSLQIFGEDTGDATTFSGSSANISSRVRTSSNVAWHPSSWSSRGASGAAQRTPNLAEIVEEIVDHPSWQSGNAMVFLFDGEGRRVAEAYEGESDKAAELSVIFSGGDGPPPGDDGLQNGQPVSNLSGAQNSEQFFQITVPANTSSLDFKIWGGSGDADIYIRYGQKPTTSSWDHRPYLNGNNESVNIANPAAGTWHVMIRAYRAYSGLSLQADYSNQGDSKVYQNDNDLAIPDNDSAGVQSAIDVTHNGDSGTIAVTVNLDHTYIGDLTVKLRAPNGSEWTLHDKSGGSSDDINQTYQVNASGREAIGRWILWINDTAGQDTGTLTSWKIEF